MPDPEFAPVDMKIALGSIGFWSLIFFGWAISTAGQLLIGGCP